MSSIDPKRVEAIAFGRQIFNETPVYSSAFIKSRISCSNCHLQGGVAPNASPMVGAAQAFPTYSNRAGRQITLEDRIQECMTRSENGMPLRPDGREMKALLAYINWLSEPHRDQEAFVGRGLPVLPEIRPDSAHGAVIYSFQCAGCHGVNGEGRRRPFPPLWGADSFNDGAGMDRIDKLAAFVRYNMPYDRKGTLSTQDAWDVAAYIHAQPRPAFNHDYDHF